MSAKIAIAAAISVPLLAAGSIAAVGAAITGGPDSMTGSICRASLEGGRLETRNLSSAQLGNAQIIARVGTDMGVPMPGEAIAIATALQESGLQNLDYGDRDSLGLFQQRPSQGWGSPAQILTPSYAARQFYSRLLQVPGWRSMPTTQAAQAVQRSGFPDAYAKWDGQAQALAAAFTGDLGCTSGDTDNSSAGTPSLAGYHLPAGLPPRVLTAITFALSQLGKPYVWGGTGPDGYDCSGLVMTAYRAAGIVIPRGSIAQSAVGMPIYDVSDLQPGDLIFIPGSDGTRAAPGHVGMAIGHGLLVEAPHTGQTVQISPIAGYWQGQISAMRRIVR